MAKPRQAGQTGSARRWVALALCGLFGLMTGCSSTPHAAAPGPDPILGVLEPPGMPKPTGVSKAATGPGSPQSYQQGGVPALPASLTSTNNATLASMSSQGPLGQPLRIDDGNSSGPPFFNRPGVAGGSTQQVPGMPGYIPPNPNPKVEPIPDSKPITAPVGPATTWQTQSSPAAADAANEKLPVLPASAALPASAENLTKQLQDRGVVDQKQVLVPEGVRLTCYVLRGQAGGFRILEATAVDYPTAAEAILKQLDATR